MLARLYLPSRAAGPLFARPPGLRMRAAAADLPRASTRRRRITSCCSALNVYPYASLFAYGLMRTVGDQRVRLYAYLGFAPRGEGGRARHLGSNCASYATCRRERLYGRAAGGGAPAQARRRMSSAPPWPAGSPLRGDRGRVAATLLPPPRHPTPSNLCLLIADCGLRQLTIRTRKRGARSAELTRKIRLGKHGGRRRMRCRMHGESENGAPD